MVTSGWAQGSWSHHPVTSPPTNQKEVTHRAALTPDFAFLFWAWWWPSCWTSRLAPVCFISNRLQEFQAKLLLPRGWMLVLGTEYLDLDQLERDFYSTRQDYAHSQQEVVTEERDLYPNSQEVSWVWSLSGGVIRGTTDWNHPPWPGPVVTTCMSYLNNRRPW